MSRSRRPELSRAITRLTYRHPRRASSSIEVVSIPELRARATDARLAAPRRADFHHLLVVTAGFARVDVDFTEYRVGPGSAIVIAPEQVHRLEASPTCDGFFVFFPDHVLPIARRPGASPTNPTRQVLLGDDLGDVLTMIALLSKWTMRDESTNPRAAHLLASLVETLRRDDPTDGGDDRERARAFAAFAQSLERHFRTTRTLGRYAELTGYATKTLGRACVAHAGVPAKAFIDRRVLLEARRLLAHSDRTIAQIAADLSFSEATNFIKFVERVGGEPPSAFRRRVRDPSRHR